VRITQEVNKWCLKYFCSEFITWIIFDDVITKHAYLDRCNQGIMTKCSNSECNARYITMNMMHCFRCMIAMMMQHEDEGFYARSKWCIWHNAITMMLTKWCIHHDARMMILAMYACMKCMKYDAYPHELMMHMSRTLQPFSRNEHLGSSISLGKD
jgi:hypothetical protein